MKLPQLLRTADRFLDRHPWFLPFIGLATGLASFVLVQRDDKLALVVTAFVVCSWLWLLIQPLIREWLCQRGSKHMSLTLINLVTQSIQQEQLFFVLPFLFLSTQIDDLSQISVTILVALAAIAATWDPFYARYIARRYATRVSFQCFCSFMTAMTVLPMALGMPLEESFYVALGFIMLWMAVILAFCRRKRRHIWQQTALVVVVPLLLWALRAHIPPAGLEVKHFSLTSELEDQTPAQSLQQVALSDLQRGLYLHAAIAAPFGLTQNIIFNWRHNDFSERIAATITGGRREGYRTYSHKTHFMDTSLGHWDVDILTPQGQLLKRVSFEVIPGAGQDQAALPPLAGK